MLPAELDEIRHARHRAIVVDNLADHPRRSQARQTREIDHRFRLAPALQNAPGAGAKRKYVTRSSKVFRIALRIDRSLDRLCSIVRRDSSRNVLTLYINRNGERGASQRGVI